MESHDKIYLEEQNKRALKNFLLWRKEKEEQEEEEETETSMANILIQDYPPGISH